MSTEIRIARAHNIGYTLSAYEPKLLEKIIKQNKNNEFVKTMAVARDHQEFNRGIPRKDFTREYKNGFKDARSLSEHDPELLERLINDRGASKDFTKGLKDGCHEYKSDSL